MFIFQKNSLFSLIIGFLKKNLFFKYFKEKLENQNYFINKKKIRFSLKQTKTLKNLIVLI